MRKLALEGLVNYALVLWDVDLLLRLVEFLATAHFTQLMADDLAAARGRTKLRSRTVSTGSSSALDANFFRIFKKNCVKFNF